jgi:hypothetical protein
LKDVPHFIKLGLLAKTGTVGDEVRCRLYSEQVTFSERNNAATTGR